MLFMKFIGYEQHAPYSLIMSPFILPFDYHDHKVVYYHSDLAGFNAYQVKNIDLHLYQLLQRKHPLAAPREHLLQMLMSTASSMIDEESFAEHHDLYLNTCELYFQDMMRYRARMRMMGVRSTIPLE
jgi:hypothetical protein